MTCCAAYVKAIEHAKASGYRSLVDALQLLFDQHRRLQHKESYQVLKHEMMPCRYSPSQPQGIVPGEALSSAIMGEFMTVKTMTQEENRQDRNQAEITCPQCHKTWTLNVAKFRSSKRRIKAKCACGCLFDISEFSIDLRRFYRKKTNLRGTYSNVEMNKTGFMRVKNVSYSGISFELEKKAEIAVGDALGVRFVLDDGQKTEIQRTVRVKSVSDNLIGAEFSDTQVFDIELCYYLTIS
jgi:hypothetical protein